MYFDFLAVYVSFCPAMRDGINYYRCKSLAQTAKKLPVCHIRYIPSEKIGQNIDPLRKSFFVTNYLHWTGTSVLQPFLGPPDPWGGLGDHGVVLGGLPPPKMPLCLRDQFKPWNGLFWLMITGNTIFLRFWVKMGLSGPKKGHFGPK